MNKCKQSILQPGEGGGAFGFPLKNGVMLHESRGICNSLPKRFLARVVSLSRYQDSMNLSVHKASYMTTTF